MELTRKQVIEELQKMLDYYSIRQDSTPERKYALVYSISSLKTDEAYQIMYEGGEIFTKDDMVAMLEEIDLQFDEICFCRKAEWKTVPEIKAEYKAVIQHKINKLRGDKDAKIQCTTS